VTQRVKAWAVCLGGRHPNPAASSALGLEGVPVGAGQRSGLVAAT